MAHRGHTTGKHISRTYTTAISLADAIAKMLDKSGLVTKVNLAIITAMSGCKVKKLVIAHDQHGLRLTVQQPPSKQELYVSAPKRDEVVAHLQQWCHSERLECTVR